MLKDYTQYFLNLIDIQLERPEIKEATPPKGTLIARESSKGRRFYITKCFSNGSLQSVETTPLGTSSSPEVMKYKLNRIRYEQRRALEHDPKILSQAIQRIRNYDFDSIKASLPPLYSDIQEYESIDLEEWSNINTNIPMQINGNCHIASDGKQLRSKSELIIYECLLANKIPFRYEDRLELKDFNNFKTIRYPDFTIRLADESYLFWEHAGLLNKEDYLNKFSEKIALYQHNNILLGINLVVTVDDSSGQIDMRSIMRVIQNMILPRL